MSMSINNVNSRIAVPLHDRCSMWCITAPDDNRSGPHCCATPCEWAPMPMRAYDVMSMSKVRSQRQL